MVAKYGKTSGGSGKKTYADQRPKFGTKAWMQRYGIKRTKRGKLKKERK